MADGRWKSFMMEDVRGKKEENIDGRRKKEEGKKTLDSIH